jgi:RNA polymerase sigma factor (sigma-70 family)
MTDLLDSIDWKQQYNRLIRFFVVMTHDPYMAEELTQDVLTLAWEIRERFDPDRAHSSELEEKVGAWIKGIARKKLKSHYSNSTKPSKSMGGFDFDRLEIPFMDPLDSLAVEDLSTAIRNTLANCSCDERTTFKLFLSGMSIREIQRTQGLAKLNTVHKRISRCMARLKRKLDQLNADEQLQQVVFQSSVEFIGTLIYIDCTQAPKSSADELSD